MEEWLTVADTGDGSIKAAKPPKRIIDFVEGS